MDRSILYSSIEDISVWSKTKMIDSDCRFCIRIVTNECIYFFQVNNFILFKIKFLMKFLFRLIHFI
jgi:hypothetical protein